MEKRNINLSELEAEARAEEEHKIAEAQAQAQAEAEEKRRAEADLTLDVADSLAVMAGEDNWLDPASVLPHLSVSLDGWNRRLVCALDVPGHVSIVWNMTIGEGGRLTIEGRLPFVVDANVRVITLAEALLRSADVYANRLLMAE